MAVKRHRDCRLADSLFRSSHSLFRAGNEVPPIRLSLGERDQFEEDDHMANEQKPDPATAQESDVSKAQSAQQPTQKAGQQPETGEQRGQFETGQQAGAEQTGDQAATGQAQAGQADEGLQGETATQQRTDIEGASLQSERGEAESGFVGAEGQADTSSELVEDEDFEKDGQGAPEGK
jgi:hypothetical protein